MLATVGLRAQGLDQSYLIPLYLALQHFYLKRISGNCRTYTTIFAILRSFEGRPDRALSEAFIGLCTDSALGNIKINNFVAGGWVRLGPSSCDI